MGIRHLRLSNILVSWLVGTILVLAGAVFLPVASFSQDVKSVPKNPAGKVPLPLEESKANPSGVLGKLPATFVGELPCADCPGIRYQLDLFPDQTFFSRMIYEERNTSFDELGKWDVSKDGKTLNLLSSEGPRGQWAIRETNTLHKLDAEGHEIESKLNFDLHRSDKFSPIEPKLKVRGMYRYMADAGLFQECSTGKRWSVATEKDNAALEAAYGKVRREAGEELLVTVEGQVVSRPKVEGEGNQTALIVEKFLDIEPGKTCADRFSTASLEGTEWELTDLGDTRIVVASGKRRPDIVLQSDGQRVAGFAGCNRLMGRYQLQADSLVFARMATTRMACADGMDTEAAFVAMLDKVKTWKIHDQHLELYDGEGKLLARFEKRAG
jgi:copper homeostasis protein (lipoprotein)